MKRITSTALLFSLAACSPAKVEETESLGETSQALNGVLSNQGFLTQKDLLNEPNENLRRANTDDYYDLVAIDNAGTTIRNGIPDLASFKSRFISAFPEIITKYYNRGDLGLGREMHCAENPFNGDIACYVINFASAPPNSQGLFSEFTFGLSPAIAFNNMAAQTEVATVAMVYRPNAAQGDDKVIFAVYGPGA